MLWTDLYAVLGTAVAFGAVFVYRRLTRGNWL